MVAAEASHSEAMYLYGMILINQGQLTEGEKFIKRIWKQKGFQAFRTCLVNCKPILLEISVRDYIILDQLLTVMEVGDDCIAGEFDDVCENCIVYKEIFRFIDYMDRV
ncbi:unnamed protein product [Microthlaspi erraticum]|uniref:Uncharacterized protein n=1 Tax=Microthlaspi erraticum TaxID=1685480 RepID=A0A6D2HGV7_9BRAS|nr:unnamed protein product [Microthlaspi erraticum]